MISTKGRYAIRFMMDIAENGGEKPVPLEETAERQHISKKYLESVVKMLVKGKLVKGASGKGGGYRLTRSPEEYNVLEILELTEGPMVSVACLCEGAEPCPQKDECRTLPMWMEFDMMVFRFFSEKKLSDLMKQK